MANKLMSPCKSFTINYSFSCQRAANKLLSGTSATIRTPKSLNIYHWLPVLNLDPVHFSGIASLCEFSAFLTACKIPLLSLTVSSLSSSSFLSETYTTNSTNVVSWASRRIWGSILPHPFRWRAHVLVWINNIVCVYIFIKIPDTVHKFTAQSRSKSVTLVD